MKQFASVNDLDQVEDLALREWILELYKLVRGDAKPPAEYEGNFEYNFGGDVFLIETLDDVEQIPTSVDDGTGHKYKTLMEIADSFDVCEEILDGEYIHIVVIATNSGGNTYLVPKEIAGKCQNISLSIELTANLWGGK